MRIALVLTLAPCLAAPAWAGIPWELDHDKAFARAQEERRPILIYFMGSPCGKVRQIGEMDTLGRVVHGDHRTDCELLEEDVWSKPDVADALVRFVAVLTGDSQQVMLNRRYEVATVPTILFADPWGNEIVRLVRYTPKDRILQLAQAVPPDFTDLQPAAMALSRDPQRLEAWLLAAAFYEKQNLRAISERYYEKALHTEAARADAAGRRGARIARGTNLLLMGRAAEAAGVFEQARAEAPEGPQSEVLLLGLVMAQHQSGRAADAKKTFEELKERFPDSPYTRKAEESLKPRAR
jgi:thiol-disulfide isomerase/thioredoxin